jgi:hypothetical protein
MWKLWQLFIYSAIFYRAQVSQSEKEVTKIVGPGSAIEITGVKIDAGSAAFRVLGPQQGSQENGFAMLLIFCFLG